MEQIDKLIKKFGEEMFSMKEVEYVEVRVNTINGMSYEYDTDYLTKGEEDERRK